MKQIVQFIEDNNISEEEVEGIYEKYGIDFDYENLFDKEKYKEFLEMKINAAEGIVSFDYYYEKYILWSFICGSFCINCNNYITD